MKFDIGGSIIPSISQMKKLFISILFPLLSDPDKLVLSVSQNNSLSTGKIKSRKISVTDIEKVKIFLVFFNIKFIVPVYIRIYCVRYNFILLLYYKAFKIRKSGQYRNINSAILISSILKHIKAEVKMDRWECQVCGYIYDPGEGDLNSDIMPGTKFGDLPDDWVCPECGALKDEFEVYEE